MATFPLKHVHYLARLHSLQLQRRLAEEGTQPSAFGTAADSVTLRGIPALGPGVSGHIPGTQPEKAVLR